MHVEEGKQIDRQVVAGHNLVSWSACFVRLLMSSSASINISGLKDRLSVHTHLVTYGCAVQLVLLSCLLGCLHHLPYM